MTIQSVDIALCTWNRADLLRQTLGGFQCLRVPDDIALTIIVVDNGSADETQKVIQAFADSEFGRSANVISAVEEQQGHTYARNRAIRESKGDLLVWTDDDVLVSSDWITKYVATANQQSEVSFWGSQIVPEFETGKPTWIDDNWSALSGCFATRDLGDQPIELTADRLPYGANFAVRGSVQRDNLFSVDLGRRGDAVLGEDEIELMSRLLESGHHGSWVTDAEVKHIIPAHRASTKYVYDYFVGQGKKLVLKGQPWHSDSASMRREAQTEYRRYWIKRLFANNQTWCSHLIRSGLAHGQWLALSARSTD